MTDYLKHCVRKSFQNEKAARPIGLYDPRVLAISRRTGYSELDSRAILQELEDMHRPRVIERVRPPRSFLEWLFNISPDWNDY